MRKYSTSDSEATRQLFDFAGCDELQYRLTEGRRKLIILAQERAGTEKLREQVVGPSTAGSSTGETAPRPGR